MTQTASEFAGVERMRSSRSEEGGGGIGFGGAAHRDGSVALKERRQLILQGREKDGNKRRGGGGERERAEEKRPVCGPWLRTVRARGPRATMGFYLHRSCQANEFSASLPGHWRIMSTVNISCRMLFPKLTDFQFNQVPI